MKKIEQSRDDMVEIYNKVIYPGYSYAAILGVEAEKLATLREVIKESHMDGQLLKVLDFELDKIVKEIQGVRGGLDKTMGDALISLAPIDFLIELQGKCASKV